MHVLEASTFLNAPIDKCFNAIRNHNDILNSIPKMKNSEVNSKLKGPIKLGNKIYILHDFFNAKITKVTKYNVIGFIPPFKIVEEFTGFFFKNCKHIHEFEEKEDGVIMKDTIEYELSFGFIGSFLNKKYVENLIREYMHNRIKAVKDRVEK